MATRTQGVSGGSGGSAGKALKINQADLDALGLTCNPTPARAAEMGYSPLQDFATLLKWTASMKQLRAQLLERAREGKVDRMLVQDGSGHPRHWYRIGGRK